MHVLSNALPTKPGLQVQLATTTERMGDELLLGQAFLNPSAHQAPDSQTWQLTPSPYVPFVQLQIVVSFMLPARQDRSVVSSQVLQLVQVEAPSEELEYFPAAHSRQVLACCTAHASSAYVPKGHGGQTVSVDRPQASDKYLPFEHTVQLKHVCTVESTGIQVKSGQLEHKRELFA